MALTDMPLLGVSSGDPHPNDTLLLEDGFIILLEDGTTNAVLVE